MPRFRKKPVEIEAFQLTREARRDNSDWPQWAHEAWNRGRGDPGSLYPEVRGSDVCQLQIGTLEGPLLVSWDDFIIQGVQGEIYPCKPDIFWQTYEPVA